MIPGEIYDKIIRHAVKAPSQLNTQPWQFEVEEGVIHLLPDFTRSLPLSDPCNTNLYISLGCALENLLLASRQLGYTATPKLKRYPLYTMVRIELEKVDKADPSPLFDQIEHRQVVRSKFAPLNISEILIKKICLESLQNGISVVPLLHKSFALQIVPLVSKGIQIMNSQKAYLKEKIDWIRCSEKQAMLSGDGVRAAALDLPLSATWLSRFTIPRQLAEKNEIKHWSSLIQHSSGLVLFSARENQVDQWIRLGSSLQRYVLKLSHAGIQYSHIPIPLEYVLIQKQLAEVCGVEDSVPLQLIRIGKGKTMPYSFRRNIVHSVVNKL